MSLQLDGVEVPTLLANPGAPVAPPIVAGHGLNGKNQIVLGASTLVEIHKQLGDTVDMRYVPGFPPKAIVLTIVGVATMPAIGIAEGLHTSMGVGAIVPADNGRLTEMLGPQGYAGCNGPNMVLLTSDGTASTATVHRAAQDLATRGVAGAGDGTVEQPELRRLPGIGARGATPGPDRQLPLHGPDTASARDRVGGRCHHRSRPHACCLGPKAQARAGHPEGDRVHTGAAAMERRLASGHRRRCWHRHRGAPGPRAWTMALDAVRRRDRSSSCTGRADRLGRARMFDRTRARHRPRARCRGG